MKKYRIGIDAKWYHDGHTSGKIVVRNWLANLSTFYDFEVFLFLDSKFKNVPFQFESKNVFPVYCWAGNNLISNLTVVPFLSEKLKLDLVIYQNFPSFWGRHLKIAFIHDVIFKSNPEYYSIKERIYFSFLKPLSRFSDSVATISLNEIERIKKYGYGPPSNEPLLVYNGCNPTQVLSEKRISFAEIKEKYKLPEIYILYLGRINIRKNLGVLLKAIQKIDKSVHLVIAGKKDWKQSEISELLNKKEINDRVVFTGYILESEIKSLMENARVFVFPSKEEGFGIPPLEAMMAGTPVVVSDIPVLREICGGAAFYADASQPDEFAEKIQMILNDPSLRENMIRTGISHVNKFTWQQTAEQLKKAVTQTLNLNKL